MSTFRNLGDTLRDDYARMEMRLRGEIRQTLTGQLASYVSPDVRVTMHWTVSRFCKDIYLRHGLKLEGWPDDILFADLSRVTGRERVLRLVEELRAGRLRFVPNTETEREAARADPLCASPGKINLGLTPCLGRDDVKKRRPGQQRKHDAATKRPPRYMRNGPKSSKWVTPEAEARAEEAERPNELFRGGRPYMGLGSRPGMLHVRNF
ncbi:hypothetical protein C8Q77DRAFT_1068923 [Trametes polyzona]|nr:hypothetical protein C8Q77DRAFT_1068923 [Trametes polyzona]